MNKCDAKLYSPTALVALLTGEFMEDGKPHTRKEVIRHVSEQAKVLGVTLKDSHLIGIHQYMRDNNCTRLARGEYQMPVAEGASENFTRIDRVAMALDRTIRSFSSIAQEIDFVDTTDGEARELELYRSAAHTLCDIKEKLLQFQTQACSLASNDGPELREAPQSPEMGGMQM